MVQRMERPEDLADFLRLQDADSCCNDAFSALRTFSELKVDEVLSPVFDDDIVPATLAWKNAILATHVLGV